MKLTEYIKGKRYGEDAHDLERQAMEDAFLQEALDGYDSVFSNHLDSIDRINSQIGVQSSKKNHRKMMVYLSVAASFVVLITVGSLLFFNNSDQMPEMAMNEMEEDVIVEDEITPTAVVAEEELVENTEAETTEEKDLDLKKEQEKAERKKRDEARIKAERLKRKEEDSSKAIMLAEAETEKNQMLAAMPAPVDADTERSLQRSAPKAKAASVSLKEDKPLYIVNGAKVEDISNIPEDDIESKEFVKDASAEVIYGADGANGVVVIKTKKKPTTFEEKDFKQYFENKAVKVSDDNSVRAEFVIDSNNRPSKIEIKRASSDEAKAEALRVIQSSPKWSEEPGKKVKVKLNW